MEKDNNFIYTGHENLLIMQHAQNYNKFLGKLIYHFGKKAHTVVDFGAGICAFGGGVRQWASKLICIEPDHFQNTILLEQGYDAYRSISEMPSAKVDYVYSVNVLEHIEHDGEALSQISSIMQPGGRLLVYVPSLPCLFSSMDTAVGHFRRYTKKNLINKVTNAGFTVVQCEYVDSLGILATLLYKLSGNSKGSINIKALKFYDYYIFPLSRICDRALRRIAGKNIFVVCEKP